MEPCLDAIMARALPPFRQHNFLFSMTTAPSSYGSDASGLICGFQFGADGRGVAIDGDAALHWLNSSQTTVTDTGAASSGGFVWLHFNLANASTEKWLQAHFELSEQFHDLLKNGSRSTRIELDDEILVAVINDVQYDFAFEPSDISTLFLSVGPRLVVSGRLKPLRSIDKLRDAVKKGALVESSVELLVHLMHDQGDVLVEIVRGCTARVDEIEDNLLAGKLETKRINLGSLRRLLVRLQRLLAPEPAALFRLLRKPPTWMLEDDVEHLRQSTEEFNVALSDMAALQERIKLLQEEIAGRVAEGNNRSLYVLTIVTVLALPFTVISGLFGMNVGGIPLADNPAGYWIVVGLIATITAIAAAVAFRKPPE